MHGFAGLEVAQRTTSRSAITNRPKDVDVQYTKIKFQQVVYTSSSLTSCVDFWQLINLKSCPHN